MLIDTHAHVQFAKYKDDADAVMQRALDAGMALINVSTQIDTSRQAVAMLDRYPERVYAAVGLHPVHTWQHEHQDLDELEYSFQTREEVFNYDAYKELAMHPKVVGIGECGLDYFRLPEQVVIPSEADSMAESRDPSTRMHSVGMTHQRIKELQNDAFLQQVKLAQELDKALIIHCRPSQNTTDAYDDMLEIIRDVKVVSPNYRFEVHCFTGALQIAQQIVELGGYIGLNGIITFDKTGVAEEVVKNIPLESIILETDAPYLTPVPFRGKRNEPVYVEYVAQKIAEWKNISFEEVATQTTQNASYLFKL